VCADKWGLELGATGYVGQSRIVRADGSLAAEAPPTGDTVIAARLTLSRPHRVWVSPKRREVLLGENRPAGAGTAAAGVQESRRITIAAIPTSVATSRFTGGMGEELYRPLQARRVTLVMLNLPQESMAEQFEMVAPAFEVTAVAFPTRADVHQRGPARIGCISGQWARSFAAARAMTLEGAEILLFFDAPDDLALMRTRALENRVFVLAANDRGAAIIAPNGQILARSTPAQSSEAVAEIDLAEAHDKTVAPKTDIFAERKRELYRY
jgi:predicted amidohydrolase